MAVTENNVRGRVWRDHQPAPVSPTADWFDLIDAGAVDDLDSDLTKPQNMTGAHHHLVDIESQGTYLAVRLGYATGDAPVTAPKVRAFGKDGNGIWSKLPLVDGTYECTLTAVAATDYDDGTRQWTEIDINGGSNVFDMLGSKSVLLLVSTASAGGTERTLDKVQGKVI